MSSQLPPQEYTRLSIPVEMTDEITEILRDRKELGYRSVTEFVKAAIRSMLTALQDESEVEPNG